MDYDNENAVPGRSKEVDAIAHDAIKSCKADPGYKTNTEDPAAGATGDEPKGN